MDLLVVDVDLDARQEGAGKEPAGVVVGCGVGRRRVPHHGLRKLVHPLDGRPMGLGSGQLLLDVFAFAANALLLPLEEVER